METRPSFIIVVESPRYMVSVVNLWVILNNDFPC